MSIVQILIEAIGFDPTQLSGRPTGYALLYMLLLFFSASLGFGVALKTPLRIAARMRTYCFIGAFISLLFVTIIQHLLFIEYQDQRVVPADTGVEETYIVPIPLPIFRSPDFDRFSVGSPGYKNAQPGEYIAEGLKEENIAATYTTVALHWCSLFLMSSCLTALLILGLKSLLYTLKMSITHNR
ncbi:hypothetical protein [Desulfobacter postgatei]|uniref:hypothetical protein n=1 Tax=Desulfobacter postgatei TaxID=2293 RepID=UPI00259BC379|nr:hypothetical protein [uncultured Desulfobacter sp.]